MPDLDSDLREALRELAGEIPPTPRVPGQMLRRARRRRLRTVVVAVVTAGLVAYGGFAGADFIRGLGPHPAPSPAGQSPTPFPTPTPGASPQPSPSGSSLPEAARLEQTFPTQSGEFAAGDGALFAFTINRSQTGVTLSKITATGSIMSKVITDPLAYYFFPIAASADSVYLGTRVIQRFTTAPDEIIRVDAATLSVVTRTTMPQEVIELLASSSGLWVELDTEILKLDRSTLATLATYTVSGAAPPPQGGSEFSSLALGPGGLWATFGNALHTTLYRFDPQSMALRSRIVIPKSGQGMQVTASPESVWISGDGFVWKVSSSGRLVGGPRFIDGLSAATAQGGGVVGLIYVEGGSAGPAGATLLAQIDPFGSVVAESKINDFSGERPIVVAGARFWGLSGRRIARWVLLHPNP